jgi:hypothetical protein
MKDFEFAKKEKVTADHDVIDDAIRERAEVRQIFPTLSLVLTIAGLYCLFDTCRSCLQTKRGEGQES